MDRMELYKIAQQRIGEYDAHRFRIKQWFTPIITGVVIAAFFRPESWVRLLVVGIVAIFLLYFVEVPILAVSKRFIDYCKKLEDDHEEPEANAPGLSTISRDCRSAWREYPRVAFCSFFRPGTLVAYVLAVVVLVAGIIIAASSK